MLAGAANLYHAAHTRKVSAAGLALLQAKLPRNSIQIARGRIRRFESYMLSHAVLSEWLILMMRTAGELDHGQIFAEGLGRGDAAGVANHHASPVGS